MPRSHSTPAYYPMSSSLQVPAAFVTLTFTQKPTKGPIIMNHTQPVYTLQDGVASGMRSPTLLYRTNGQLVAQFVWKGVTHGKRVTMYGVESKSLVTKKKEKW